MAEIPVYLKTEPQMPRPTDQAFYLLTGDGTFFCRNHSFFQSDVPAARQPRTLAPHAARCVIRYPKLGVAALEYIVGFFDRIFELYSSEAVVLLYWDLKRRRYKLVVPEQTASVWESYTGRRSPMDVTYKTPLSVPPHHLLVGDIHCHGDIGAYASFTDKKDEEHRDGVHAIVGHIDEDPPQFHQEIAVDGYRFKLKFGHLFRGYKKRRRNIPKTWIDKVNAVAEGPGWGKSSATTYYLSPNGDGDEN